jgi:small-conductance mechanosensitive channel
LDYLGTRLKKVFLEMLDNLVAKIPDLIAALLLFAVFMLAAMLVRRMVRSALRRVRVESNVAAMITRLSYYAVLLVGIIEALSQLNVNLAALGIGVGMLGFALGFALKDILSNFLAGVLILWTRHFTAGDQIRIQDYEGTVEAVEMRGTIIRTYDGRRVTIPNSTVYTNAVINNTVQMHRRSSVLVSVGYETDMSRARSLIIEALKSTDGVLDDPPPDTLVKRIDRYAIEIEIRFWTPAQQLDVLTLSSDATEAIHKALKDAGVHTPYPTQVVLLEENRPPGENKQPEGPA